MLHVDVRTDKLTRDVLVEVSNDGAPWHRIATVAVTAGMSVADIRAMRGEGEQYARAWIAGARYAGAEVRGTSHGYGI
jgi:hypothetical protein